MKKLFATLACVGLLLGGSSAIADSDEEVKYRVTITIVYNELSINDAKKKIGEALYDHQTACKTEVKAKKVDEDTWVTYSNGTFYTTDTVVVGGSN